jgi:hypothetical protein
MVETRLAREWNSRAQELASASEMGSRGQSAGSAEESVLAPGLKLVWPIRSAMVSLERGRGSLTRVPRDREQPDVL